MRLPSFLGFIYSEGYGIEPDQEAAFKWYTLSAQNGNMDAQYNLAYCYKNGCGVEQDLDKARTIYTQLADSGYFMAKIALSEMEFSE